MRYRGSVQGGVIILEAGTVLPDGTEVEVSVGPSGRSSQEEPGQRDTLLALFNRPAVCSGDDVDALVEVIEQGKRPANFRGAFDDELLP